jgi:hypothetical protein
MFLLNEKQFKKHFGLTPDDYARVLDMEAPHFVFGDAVVWEMEAFMQWAINTPRCREGDWPSPQKVDFPDPASPQAHAAMRALGDGRPPGNMFHEQE